ncbi:PaaX family transcriptional regulator [Gordoniibacillus kamchatkensis]|uniref:PaaX family transcriptional regulator n=1 Tax=Gordoniibacillus kamchatkensis TaxID=1590651 RepID=A0ABR5A5S6_9BACL|nr:PaaX family transcriptional regulator C-terminal domain-containing protein [Paenibacillus sp. VKM B-2647]KIL36421.1 PaaX family transcriptional regulator [Paenibacillus sp. VKM B-2647]
MLSVEKQMLFLLSRADDLETQDLIRIYENRGYSAPYIRNALSRLKKDGYADSPTRSMYRITDAGRKFIRSINFKPQLYGHAWDRTWHLVLSEFPETERRRRDQFRADLLQTGFGLLYDGVYISPWPYREETDELIRKHAVERYVTCISGTMTGRAITADEAADIWSLGAVAEAYERKREWFAGEFKPQAERLLMTDGSGRKGKAGVGGAVGGNVERGKAVAGRAGTGADLAETPGTADEMQLFLLYLQLGEAISELYLTDPMLPEELLRSDWVGRRTLEELNGYMDRIVAAIPRDSAYSRFIR